MDSHSSIFQSKAWVSLSHLYVTSFNLSAFLTYVSWEKYSSGSSLRKASDSTYFNIWRYCPNLNCSTLNSFHHLIKNQQLVFLRISAKNIVNLNWISHHADFHTRKKISKLLGSAKVMKENRFYFYFKIALSFMLRLNVKLFGQVPYIKDVGGHERFTSFFSLLLIELIVS